MLKINKQKLGIHIRRWINVGERLFGYTKGQQPRGDARSTIIIHHCTLNLQVIRVDFLVQKLGFTCTNRLNGWRSKWARHPIWTAIQMTILSWNLEFFDQVWTTLTSYLHVRGSFELSLSWFVNQINCNIYDISDS